MEGNKLRVAKKCLDEIFLDTYQKRDRLAIITAGGEHASYLLPFTSNIEKGRALIDSIGFGGTTPLSSGIRIGLRVLEDIMRKEPWMVPIMVIITDGGANVPLFMGGNIQDEFTKLSTEMDYVNIRPLVINVGDDSALCEEIVWKTDGKYLSLSLEDESILSNLKREKEVEDILHEALLSLINRKTTSLSFDGYTKEALVDVKNILKNNPVKIEVNEECHYGCSPEEDPSYLCRECRLKLNQDTNSIIRSVGIGLVSEHQKERELIGELFVRYLVQPGTLMKANNGLLFVEDEPAYDKFSEILESGINTGELQASNAEYTEYYPFRPRGVFFTRDKGYLDLGNRFYERTKDKIDEKLWIVNSEKKFKADHKKFIDELEQAREEKIDTVNGVINNNITVKIPSYLVDMLERVTDADKSKDMIKLMKASAALKNKDKVGLEDLKCALKNVDVTLKNEESNAGQYLFSKLSLVLSAKEKLKLTIVDGYTTNEFDDAIELLENIPISIETPVGCTSNCDPNDENLCPECRIRWGDKNIKTSETSLPIVRIKGNESLEELRGELFVKYVSTSDILLRANRGLLVIESMKNMNKDAVDFLSELLENGRFTLKNEDHSQTFEVDISVIARKDIPNTNKLIDDSLSFVIRKENYEDILPAIFFEGKDQFFQRIMDNIENARQSDISISDELLDYIIRVCTELEITRYDAEIKIEHLTRAMSAWDGQEVTNETIDESIRMLAPLMVEGISEYTR